MSFNTSHTAVVSFSGIDGAGKTTQIGKLTTALKESGLRVRHFTFWDHVAVLPRWRENSMSRFRSLDETGSLRNDKNVRRWYLTAGRLAFSFMDALHLRFMLARVPEADVLIFDRYTYDPFAALPLESPAVRWMWRVSARIAPRPTIAYVLDADPEIAYERKQEYPLEFLKNYRKSYLALARTPEAPIVVIPQQDPEAVHAEIIRQLVQALPIRLRKRLTCPAQMRSGFTLDSFPQHLRRQH